MFIANLIRGIDLYCRKCGSEIGDADACPNCGEVIEKNNGGITSGIQTYTPNGVIIKTVNKWAYALLALFLGALGIHRFYAGKAVSGVIYLLITLFTFGFGAIIFGLMGLIECIIAVTRIPDQYGNIPVYANKYFV